MKMDKAFFNAHHSPIGAFASFTLGSKGATGGLGQELTGPANQNIFIGLEKRATEPVVVNGSYVTGQKGKSVYQAFPFFDAASDESTRYDIEKEESIDDKRVVIDLFRDDQIKRDFNASADEWSAGDISFKIISPVHPLPEPDKCSIEELKLAVTPSVLVEITVDNTDCDKKRTAFFGYEGNDPYSSMRRVDNTLKGVGQGQITSITTKGSNVKYGLGFNIKEILYPDLEKNLLFGLGPVGAMIMETPANKIRVFRFAVSFYRHGIATANMETSYYYTKFFKDIDEVANFALDNFDTYSEWAEETDAMIKNANLSDEQKFMMAHSIRSYYGSTQFLMREDNSPFWCVNEGEYRMMNTFDLTVDQLFFEIKMNPWCVKNELDMFVEHYSYQDKVRFPNDSTEYPGGISFTHDMGVGNVMSRQGFSSYEIFGLSGCFSHMTHEQLVNWVLCASVYFEKSKDYKWLNQNLRIFEACLESMCNRDNPDPEKRNGVMSLDSSRCMGGAEITTYDSLDESLGQARNNIYMAVKCWAAYLALEKILQKKKNANFAEAGRQAELCAETLLSHVTDDEYIPAIIDEENDSKIISAVEGLVFPYFNGCRDALKENGRFGKFLGVLKKHLQTILVPGVCLFDNSAWKLSSTSDNSWLSKIYLCQFVAREILDISTDYAIADKAHMEWLLNDENAYFAWSDQMVNGIAKGSKYYPRGVTSILWLEG